MAQSASDGSTIKKAVSTAKTFIDTCSLLSPGYPKIENDLFRCLHEAGEKLIVPMSVINELNKLSIRGDNDLVKNAKYALTSLATWQQRNLVIIRGEETDNKLADNVFLVQFTRFRDKYNLTLITQDRGLATDILNLNKLASQSSKHRIAVFFITDSGELRESRGTGAYSRPAGHTDSAGNSAEGRKRLFTLATSISPLKDDVIPANHFPGLNDTVYTVLGKKYITLVSELGKGGEAITWNTSEKDLVCKIYRPERLTRHRIEKLGKMIGCDFDCPGICWPTDVVLNRENKIVGYLMPKAEGVELQRSVFIPPLLNKHFPKWTRRELVQLTLSILDKLHYLHANNIILGDINPANILVKNEKEVYFVDTDSYQIEEFHCPVGTPAFTAPELQTRKDYNYLRTPGNESFAVATLLFRLMLPGKLPYAQQDGDDIRTNICKMDFSYPFGEKTNKKTPNGPWRFCWSHLPYKIKEAFYESFRREGSRAAENNRVSVAEWRDLFRSYLYLLESGKFVQQDAESIKIFPRRFKYVGNAALIRCLMCGDEYPEDQLDMGYCRNCLHKGEEKPCAKCGKPILYTNYRKLIQKKPPHPICMDCYQKQSQIYETRTCQECKRSFTITRGEYDYFQSLGFDLPKRCPTCRKLGSASRPSASSAHTGSRQERPIFELFKRLFNNWR